MSPVLKLKELILRFISYRQAECFKTSLAFILYYSGIAFIAGAFLPKGASILVYHSISDGKRGVFSDNIVFSEIFEKQISYLAKKYKIVPLSLLIERLESKKEVPRDWVVLTFDDGYKDNLDNVLPVIEKYNAFATFYITMDVVKRRLVFFYDLIQKIINSTGKKAIIVAIDDKDERFDLSSAEKKNEAVLQMVLKTRGKSNEERIMFVESLKERCSEQIDTSNEKERLYLSEEDLRTLQESGNELASHSVSHVNLVGMSDRKLDEEIVGSKKEIGRAHV